MATCACGVVASIVGGICWCRKPLRGRGVPVVPVVLVGLATTYLISAAVNGLSLTTLAETGAWAGCAGLAFVAAAQDRPTHERWLRNLGWVGIATSVIAMLVYAHIIAIPGGITAGRLEFTFQYANATGAWFGSIAFLCLLAPDERLHSFAALPVAAMLLTESAGILIVFAAVALVVGIPLAQKSAWGGVRPPLTQGVLAIALYACVRVLATPIAALPVAVVLGVCYRLSQGWSPSLARFSDKQVSLALLLIIVVATIVAMLLMPERMSTAVASLVERGYHLRDGFALWFTSPLLGVGPDNWQYLYPYIQSAPYATTVVHSSFAQTFVDAGLLGGVCLVAACALGIRAIAKNAEATGDWQQPKLWMTAFLMAHALIDFDLQFGALAFLLVYLLAYPGGKELRIAQKPTGLAAGVASLALCLPLAAMGLLCAFTQTTLSASNDNGNYQMTRQLFAQSPFASIDVGAQSAYVAACYELKDYDEVVRAYQMLAAPSDQSATYAALAYYQKHDAAHATEVIIEHLEAQPYNTAFCNTAQKLAQTYEIDEAQHARYNAAVHTVQRNVAQYKAGD